MHGYSHRPASTFPVRFGCRDTVPNPTALSDLVPPDCFTVGKKSRTNECLRSYCLSPETFIPRGGAGRRPVHARTRAHTRPRLLVFARKFQAQNQPFFLVSHAKNTAFLVKFPTLLLGSSAHLGQWLRRTYRLRLGFRPHPGQSTAARPDLYHTFMLAVPAEQYQPLRPGFRCQPQQFPTPTRRAHDPRCTRCGFTNQLLRCLTHAIIP